MKFSRVNRVKFILRKRNIYTFKYIIYLKINIKYLMINLKKLFAHKYNILRVLFAKIFFVSYFFSVYVFYVFFLRLRIDITNVIAPFP